MERIDALAGATPSEVGRPGIARTDLDRVETELTGIDQAMTRLDDATFGTCQLCQARLDDELLAADPLASRCADHR